MPNKMLIDASHQEETRVVVLRGNRIEEFDFESQDKKQLKGNIYLARVTRVEPSLQAAFVEYGGNRHGFLAFSEIHPDYYQIPFADRQAVLRAEAEEASEEDEADEEAKPKRERARAGGGRRRGRGRERGRDAEVSVAETNMQGVEPSPEDSGLQDEAASAADSEGPAQDTPPEDNNSGGTIAAGVEADVVSEPAPESSEDRGTVEEVSQAGADDHEVESVGAEDALEEAQNRRRPVRRHYKIQEVIKRRQILLVQVVKEERGNKGAALTTYLSLAGRYSVLMPNTARGGGISRKITSVQDRKRLKEVMADLEVPQGMGVILRTAGESRTKAEIKRDYEYLMRMWENVRNLTLQSTAPALVYEEGSLIKRSVRDLYNKDIDEILVAGEDGYREAKDFMRMLMPSHAKVVQPYRDTTPLFMRNGVEAQLDKMLQPQVTLKSGGYLIINQTEALVAIDVNSGRSTREHSIEETALHTNLEAAEEVARQLRLRDLAGLIVIDFIDMEENRNNRAVEKKLKDCLKNDRARIQVGRISHFGLMEMSRQRIRASVLESTMKPCAHCGGTGHVRSDSSIGLAVVRAIEEFLLKDSKHHVSVRAATSTALYVLNHKRAALSDMERRFQLTITVEADETLGAQNYAVSRGAVVERPEGFVEAAPIVHPVEPEEEDEEIVAEEETIEAGGDAAAGAEAGSPTLANGEAGNRERRKRRRRRRRGGRDHGDSAPGGEGDTEGEAVEEAFADEASENQAEPGIAEAIAADAAVEVQAEPASDAEEEPARKRRRGKRGGKKSRTDDEAQEAVAAEEAPAVVAESEPVTEAEPAAAEPPAKPKRARRSTKAKKAEEESVAEAVAQPAAESVPAEAGIAESPAQPETGAEAAPASRRRASSSTAAAKPVVSSGSASAEPEADEKPKKVGWWQKRSFF